MQFDGVANSQSRYYTCIILDGVMPITFLDSRSILLNMQIALCRRHVESGKG